MKQTVALNQNRDFRRLYGRGRSVAGPLLVMYVMPNRLGYNRLGITASKKLGGAVGRNRVRRLIKEAYRLNETRLLRGFDLVLVARSRLLQSKCPQVERALLQAAQQARILDKNV